MTKRRLIPSTLCVLMLASAIIAQSARTAAPSTASPASKTAAQQSLTAMPAAASLYNWQIRPNDNDGYFSSNIPQPVCAQTGGVFKIFIFSNFDYYPSKNFNNYSNAVRVGAITTPADTYQFLSTNVTGDPHTLPGARQEFAATSIIKAGDTESTIYIFGGKTSSGELGDVYSYTPTAGFTFVTNIPTFNSVPGARSGAVAVPSMGKIYLFGGQQGNAVLDQVLEFDPVTKNITLQSPMPQAFYGARAMTKAVGTNNYIYLVGGKEISGGGYNNKIYRYNVATKQMKQIMDLSGAPLLLPSDTGYPMATWDPSGNVRIIAAGGHNSSGVWTWGNIQAWILTDNYTLPNDGKATLTPAPYNDSARARDMAGAVKCGDSTYLIGGTYGHGTTFQNRGLLVDKLGLQSIKMVDTKAINIKTQQ